MILVGNQRGGGSDLARHLMKEDNERVAVHELRGFASDNLHSAFQESYAISRGTRCKQHLFSLSLNPPKDQSVAPELFIDAANRAEKRLGLSGQPRAIVFHEKRGADGEVRRHAHAVWCRIDAEKMRAVQLSHSSRKLQDLGRELYLEHGWKMPRGFVRSVEANPRNYTLAEWQQAKRAKKGPERLKATFQDSWAISDSRESLAQALREKGYILARGDRRGVVAVDHRGEVFSVSRWVGKKSKVIGARIGDPASLPDTSEAHRQAAKIVADRLKELKAERDKAERARQARDIEREKQRHEANRREREKLLQAQRERRQVELAERQARLRKGLLGLLDRITGKRKRTEVENRSEAERATERDGQELSVMTKRQQAIQQSVRECIEQKQSRGQSLLAELEADMLKMASGNQPRNDLDRDAFVKERRAAVRRDTHQISKVTRVSLRR